VSVTRRYYDPAGNFVLGSCKVGTLLKVAEAAAVEGDDILEELDQFRTVGRGCTCGLGHWSCEPEFRDAVAHSAVSWIWVWATWSPSPGAASCSPPWWPRLPSNIPRRDLRIQCVQTLHHLMAVNGRAATELTYRAGDVIPPSSAHAL